MPEILTIRPFLERPGPVLDVRSPGEFAKAQIPGAVNLPLFSDDERAAVGTCYKQQGRDQAVELGLTFVGPKMASLVQQAKAIAPDRQLRLHCWRGGMRSASVAWLLETAGFQVTLLGGGYKAYRQWVRATLTLPRPSWILGGMTGTGKTQVLQALAALGEQVLDLEGLANHRGSSYGNLCLPAQPSTEHYENLIAQQWAALDGDRRVWIEAESRQVGRCRVPLEMFEQMERSPVLEIQRNRAERIALLESIYGEADLQGLIEATQRIGRRLGPQNTKAAVEAISQGHLAPAIELVLNYYDKTYRYDLERRSVPRFSLDGAGLDPLTTAQALLEQVRQCETAA
jgi:tRNA 2-selenouridine synthase